MKKLKIRLKNCYGIGFLEQEIDFTKNSCCVIYAPNGTMKTSFTRVFKDLAEKKDSSDRIYNERLTEREILMDGVSIDSESIQVFENEDANGKESVSRLLTDPDLKKKYDDIHSELAKAKKSLTSKIKNLSKSSDIESEILDFFNEENATSIYDCFLKLKESVEGILLPVYNFKYNDVFDKKGLVKDFLENNKETVAEYFNKYNSLLHESKFFSEGEWSFGTTQASALLASVEDDRFFLADHKIELKDGTRFNSKDELKERVNNEIIKIFEDDGLQGIYQKLEKELNKNTSLKNFKEAIKNNPAIVSKLIDYDQLRKDVIVGYLQRQKDDFLGLCHLYESKKEELFDIIQKASTYTERWNKIIELFNARFFVPFKAKVSNLPDVLLHEKAASLTFEYQDEEGEDLKLLEEKKSQEILSQGELRAYNIMQNLFVIEGLKDDEHEHLLIMDDIADSFDYKNKYAILEYMYDILQYSKFKLIVLTHNFDFNRTAVSRLKTSTYFAYRRPGRVVELKVGPYRQDLLSNQIIKQAHRREAAFVSMIPFVRNLIEYAKGSSSDDFKLLTACLHDKSNTRLLKKGQLYDCMKPYLVDLAGIDEDHRDKLYIDILNEATSVALSDSNEIDIPNKIVLSISVRLKTDTYLKSILTPDQIREAKENHNQTGELCQLFKKYYSTSHPNECIIVNKVLMLTSENIHLNNFMFEPIVDMPIAHLKALYEEVVNLRKSE